MSGPNSEARAIIGLAAVSVLVITWQGWESIAPEVAYKRDSHSIGAVRQRADNPNASYYRVLRWLQSFLTTAEMDVITEAIGIGGHRLFDAWDGHGIVFHWTPYAEVSFDISTRGELQTIARKVQAKRGLPHIHKDATGLM